MRIAVLSDLHGNLAALEAVLEDAHSAGAETYWVLGDLVAYGPRPVEVVERVRGLPGLRCVRGNTDRYVLTGDITGMVPTVDDERLRGEIHASLAWTRASIADAGHAGWLRDRPLENPELLHDGSLALLVHASPGRDDGPGAQPDATDEELASLGFARDVADLVLVGHTHLALDRRADGTHVVNPGPVSLPRERDGLARWALLTTRDGGCDVDLRRAAYDLESVVTDLHRVGHPAAGWIAGKLGGERASHGSRRS